LLGSNATLLVGLSLCLGRMLRCVCISLGKRSADQHGKCSQQEPD
jgi:hypothetical protein